MFKSIFFVILAVTIIFSLVLFSLFFIVGNDNSFFNELFKPKPNNDPSEHETNSVDIQQRIDELNERIAEYDTLLGSEYMFTVSGSSPLPADYSVGELADITKNPAFELKTEAEAQLDKLLTAIEEAGYKYVITAAYRTSSQQNEVFSSTLQDFLKAGYTIDEAQIRTTEICAVGGQSEFETGLVFSINTTKSTSASDFESSELFSFLKEHAAEYGFVLRYPQNKKEITGLAYSPFTYRYVGDTDSAKYIAENNLSLEEYIDYLKHQKAYAEQSLEAIKNSSK